MPKPPEGEPQTPFPSFPPPLPGEPKPDDYEYYSRRKRQKDDSVDRPDDTYHATEKESFEFDVLDAKDALQSRFGIEHLSHIEEWRLRKIVEECIAGAKKYEALRDHEDLQWGHNSFGIATEAVARWLRDLYDIDVYSVDSIFTIVEYTGKSRGREIWTPVFKTHLRSEAYKKEKELYYQGRPTGIDIDYTQEFKDHIRIVREEAHNNQL